MSNTFHVSLTVADFTINKDGDVFHYRVTPLCHDPEIVTGAWRFQHCDDQGQPVVEREPYDVQRHANGSLTCDCLGFLRWAFCKHTECLRIFLSGQRPTPEEAQERHQARRRSRREVA